MCRFTIIKKIPYQIDIYTFSSAANIKSKLVECDKHLTFHYCSMFI